MRPSVSHYLCVEVPVIFANLRLHVHCYSFFAEEIFANLNCFCYNLAVIPWYVEYYEVNFISFFFWISEFAFYVFIWSFRLFFYIIFSSIVPWIVSCIHHKFSCWRVFRIERFLCFYVIVFPIIKEQINAFVVLCRIHVRIKTCTEHFSLRDYLLWSRRTMEFHLFTLSTYEDEKRI